jgi:hypothetical protein
MTTICVELDLMDYEVAAIIDNIHDRFPCFITMDPLGFGLYEVSIQCRQEDAAAIETMLAPYV